MALRLYLFSISRFRCGSGLLVVFVFSELNLKMCFGNLSVGLMTARAVDDEGAGRLFCSTDLGAGMHCDLFHHWLTSFATSSKSIVFHLHAIIFLLLGSLLLFLLLNSQTEIT